MQNRLSKLRSIFDAFLVPTWFHFASQNPPKRSKNRPQNASKFGSILGSFFLLFGLRLENQVGAMLVTLSAKMEGVLWSFPFFLVAMPSFFDIFSVLTPSYGFHFGASGPHLSSVWEVFGSVLAPCLGAFWRMDGLVGIRGPKGIS